MLVIRLSTATALAGLALWAPAAQAAPEPFGHPCRAEAGVRFCPTDSDAQRVPSWDGVPLDVDVTLPPEGDGPFPTLVMLHGLGGDKRTLEADRPSSGTSRGLPIAGAATVERYNNLFYAQRGYAVVNPSIRGFGRSCGRPDSRSPDCARGWVHFLDLRYEVRDIQHLLGLLVDGGVARPGALGATGYSMGGGISVRLAYLRDRVRLPDGTLVPWTSPGGTPLALSAAFSRWGAGHGVATLLPNGRPLDAAGTDPALAPLGVLKQSSVSFLFGLARGLGFVAPRGADPTADLAGWQAVLERGEPYGADARAIASELATHHGATSVFDGRAAPLFIEAGVADDITALPEVLRVYRQLLTAGSPVALAVGDVGHFRGTNVPTTVARFSDEGTAFLDAWLQGSGAPPPPGAVTAIGQACAGDPPTASAPTFDALATGVRTLTSRRRARVRSGAAHLPTAKAITPGLGSRACLRLPRARRTRGTWSADWPAGGMTLAGLPILRANIRHRGATGQLAARLWDLDPRGRRQLVTRGLARLTRGQTGRVRLELFGNVYRFAPGHRLRLELLGRDPGFLRPSNGRFTIDVSRVALALPQR